MYINRCGKYGLAQVAAQVETLSSLISRASVGSRRGEETQGKWRRAGGARAAAADKRQRSSPVCGCATCGWAAAGPPLGLLRGTRLPGPSSSSGLRQGRSTWLKQGDTQN